MKLEGSLPRAQHSVIYPYPEPDQSTPHTPIILLDIDLILFSHRPMGHPSGHSPSGFFTRALHAPLLYPYMLHAPPISSSFIL